MAFPVFPSTPAVWRRLLLAAIAAMLAIGPMAGGWEPPASPPATGRAATGRKHTTTGGRHGAAAKSHHGAAAANTVAWRDTLRLQVALDRAGFSPGVIDARAGAKTAMAVRSYLRAHSADSTPAAPAAPPSPSRTGVPGAAVDPNQAVADRVLGDLPTTTSYVVTPSDLNSVGVVPRSWKARAALSTMPYESLPALLAERGHCTLALLARLNPGRDLSHVPVGETVDLPNVGAPTSIFNKLPAAVSLRVDLDHKTVTALDATGRAVAVFYCSIAKFAAKRPHGSAKVKTVVLRPEYTFDPKMYPEVKDQPHKLTIRPGPRNPVGLAWIGLNLPGYGIHGSPAPELIGKTGSHGCFRLTNWDAMRLARMVKVGTPVRFVGGGPGGAALASR